MGEFGEFLQNARAYKGVTLRDAERATRINRRYLAALEQERFEELPPLTYARGIVRSYAQYLGLDPVTVLAMFESAHGQRSGGFRVVPAVKPIRTPAHWTPNFAVIAFMVVISAVVFAWLYSAYIAPPATLTTPTAPPAAPATTPGALAGSAPTPTVVVAAGGSEAVPPATETPTPAEPPAEAASPSSEGAVGSPEPALTATPEPEQGLHTFEIVAQGQVWVQATVDGEVVLAEVLQTGERRAFTGLQMHVVSGNAPLVRIYVDGIDQGPLGIRWDDQATFP